MVEPETEIQARDYYGKDEERDGSSASSSSASRQQTEDEKPDRPTHTGTDLSLRRTVSRRETLLSRIRSRPPIGPFTHPLAHHQTTVEQLVDFDGPDDPYRPMNWPMKKKIYTTVLYGFTTMSATWASAVYSPGIDQISEEFHISTEVATLGLTLLLFGFGLGPLLWAPLSECYGRRVAVLTPVFVAACFSFGTATAKDVQTIMITRFFAGFFGSAPVTNTGGVLGDLFNPGQRGIAMAGYALAVVGGPCLGPIVGSAVVVQPYLRWRWTEYLTGILMLFTLLLDVIWIDETYPPSLLVVKARRLRHETGNWALHAKFEEWDVSIKELARKFLIRPFQLLGTPICFLMALYASFLYGILYMQLGAVPIIFQEGRGWGRVTGSLPFLGILVGAWFGCALNVYNQKRYNFIWHKAGERAVPEARLPPMMVGSIFFSAGMFITGWTADKKYPWIAPVIGLSCIGVGFFTIFQAALNYLVDTFQKYSASAVGANTFLRSAFAAAFPLVVTPMYHNLGVPWASSLTGFIGVAMLPIPYFFFFYGKKIRARSKWSRDSVFD